MYRWSDSVAVATLVVQAVRQQLGDHLRVQNESPAQDATRFLLLLTSIIAVCG